MLFGTGFRGRGPGARDAARRRALGRRRGGRAPGWALRYEGLLPGSPEAEPEVEVGEADPFYFNLTSGTTGVPKAYAS